MSNIEIQQKKIISSLELQGLLENMIYFSNLLLSRMDGRGCEAHNGTDKRQ